MFLGIEILFNGKEKISSRFYKIFKRESVNFFFFFLLAYG